jgi:PucR C-terminal helix-turn-helix domain
MFGLLLRLSSLDADAASAVRVIGFYDALSERGADIKMIMRQTAMLAECSVGVRTADAHLSERVEPSGVAHSGGPPPGSRVHRTPSGDEVWLERDGDSHPLDDLLVERFALAVAVVLSHRPQEIDHLDRSALIQVAISAGASNSERRRALDRLGIRAKSVLHVLAVAGAPERLDEFCYGLPESCIAQVGASRVVLTPQLATESMGIPVGCRVGVARPHLAEELRQAWREACTALRFSLPSKHSEPPYTQHEGAIVRFEDLGGFAVVAEAVTAVQISQVADVIALNCLAEHVGGEEMIRTLEAVAATDSLRGAAAILHMHHNTVAHRVARAEQVLSYSVTDLYGRPRLMLALMLQRIGASPELT